MKPLHLNLASRPFRDYRPLYLVVVVASILIAVMMFLNIDTYLRYVRETKTKRAQIDKLEQQIEEEQRRTEQVNQRLKTVDVKLLSSQTQFVNTQLAQRAFSWSELLDRLERVLPDDVRVQTIAPVFDRNGMIHLSLNCDTKTGEGMINTIRRFNADPNFSGPFPASESVTPTGYKFVLAVDYRPSIARVVE